MKAYMLTAMALLVWGCGPSVPPPTGGGSAGVPSAGAATQPAVAGAASTQPVVAGAASTRPAGGADAQTPQLAERLKAGADSFAALFTAEGEGLGAGYFLTLHVAPESPILPPAPETATVRDAQITPEEARALIDCLQSADLLGGPCPCDEANGCTLCINPLDGATASVFLDWGQTLQARLSALRGALNKDGPGARAVEELSKAVAACPSGGRTPAPALAPAGAQPPAPRLSRLPLP